MYRCLVSLLLAFLAGTSAAAPVKPIVPCNGRVFMFGDAVLLGKGVRLPDAADLAARMETFFGRACPDSVEFERIAEGGATLIEQAPTISEIVARSPRSVVFVHFPFADIEADVSVESLLRAYGRILAACASSGSTCIIGGQQPVNSFSQKETDRQRELERRASAAFGPSYMPVFTYFESEAANRRLMLPLDSGDGRFVEDYGHELLFKLYRQRLLELTAAGTSR